jgi:hypothetical protein
MQTRESFKNHIVTKLIYLIAMAFLLKIMAHNLSCHHHLTCNHYLLKYLAAPKSVLILIDFISLILINNYIHNLVTLVKAIVKYFITQLSIFLKYAFIIYNFVYIKKYRCQYATALIPLS